MAKTMQQWIEDHVPEFISSVHWPSASPHLIPRDYKLWSALEGMVCTRRRNTLESLKRALVEVVENIPMDVVRTAIDALPNRLRRCIRSNDGYFE